MALTFEQARTCPECETRVTMEAKFPGIPYWHANCQHCGWEGGYGRTGEEWEREYAYKPESWVATRKPDLMAGTFLLTVGITAWWLKLQGVW